MAKQNQIPPVTVTDDDLLAATGGDAEVMLSPAATFLIICIDKLDLRGVKSTPRRGRTPILEGPSLAGLAAAAVTGAAGAAANAYIDAKKGGQANLFVHFDWQRGLNVVLGLPLKSGNNTVDWDLRLELVAPAQARWQITTPRWLNNNSRIEHQAQHDQMRRLLTIVGQHSSRMVREGVTDGNIATQIFDVDAPSEHVWDCWRRAAAGMAMRKDPIGTDLLWQRLGSPNPDMADVGMRGYAGSTTGARREHDGSAVRAKCPCATNSTGQSGPSAQATPHPADPFMGGASDSGRRAGCDVAFGDHRRCP